MSQATKIITTETRESRVATRREVLARIGSGAPAVGLLAAGLGGRATPAEASTKIIDGAETMGAVGENHPDAELLALGRQYDEAVPVDLDNLRRWRKLSDECEDSCPDLRDDANDEERRAWYERWKRWRINTGHEAMATDLNHFIETVVTPLEKRILAIAPVTIAGLAVKAKVIRHLHIDWWFDNAYEPIEPHEVDDWGDQMSREFIDEVIAFGEGRLS